MSPTNSDNDDNRKNNRTDANTQIPHTTDRDLSNVGRFLLLGHTSVSLLRGSLCRPAQSNGTFAPIPLIL